MTAAAGLELAGIDGQVAAAARAAARAVRVGPAGVRVRMPVLGSVEHGTPAAALKGCPCRGCDQLRDRLLVAPATAAAPSVRQAPARVGPVDLVAVERACAGELPAGWLTVSERAAAVSRLTGSGLSARQVGARIGVSPRTVVRARRRSLERAELPAAEAVAGLLGWSGGGSEAWRDEALCRQVDPELFFPETGGSARQAKQVCGRCPVRVECLDWAIAHDQRFGVWGGLTVSERMQLRRQRDRTERTG